jgi:hypothetical protein
MTIITALDDRLRRAARIIKYASLLKTTSGIWRVGSESGNGNYTVKVKSDGSTLVSARCTCPDWRKRNAALTDILAAGGQPHPGIPLIDGSVVCKHCLAALLMEGFFQSPEPDPVVDMLVPRPAAPVPEAPIVLELPVEVPV